MKRTSLLAELELHYIYALHLTNGRVGRGTPYFTIITEYIDSFYYKFDVIEDLRIYFKLFNDYMDCQELYDRFKMRIEKAE